MKRTTGVFDLDAARFDEAADVIASAFVADPLMDSFFADVPPPRMETIRRQFTYLCLRHASWTWPLWGVDVAGRLAGVAFVIPPGPERFPLSRDAETAYEHFRSGTTEQAAARLERYSDLVEGFALPAPHVYVMTLGVRPELQRQGVGTILLTAAHDMSRAHPTSRGVGLDTENCRNVGWYERLGYRVATEADIEGLHIWSMFHPNDQAAFAP